jgi:hypothetical protein
MPSAATAPQPATLVDWLSAELDKKLATLPDDGERYYFLSRQYNIWNQRRNRFFQTDGESESQAPHPQFGFLTATDFLLILGFIDRAKEKIVRAKVPA